MSATTPPSAADAIEGCRPTDATPVTLDARTLETTAKPYLREVKSRLDDRGYVPAELRASASFDDGDALAAQAELDRVRDLVFAASFLGVSTLAVSVDDPADADADAVTQGLTACRERADREGVTLTVDGPFSLD